MFPIGSIARMCAEKFERKGYPFYYFFLYGGIPFIFPPFIVVSRLPFRCLRCNLKMQRNGEQFVCSRCGDTTVNDQDGLRVPTYDEIRKNLKPIDPDYEKRMEERIKLKDRYSQKATEELLSILETESDGKFSDRAYWAIRQVLSDRGVK